MNLNNENPSVVSDLTIEDITKYIPHRYPMLLVDRLESIHLGQQAVGVKGVTVNEPFFQGHFPGLPVMPGVLIIEALAQTAAVLVMKTLEITSQDHVVYFMSIQEARFRRPVVPGDQLKMHVTKAYQRGMVWQFSGQAFVDQKMVAQATFTAQIRPKDSAL